MKDTQPRFDGAVKTGSLLRAFPLIEIVIGRDCLNTLICLAAANAIPPIDPARS